MGKKPRRLSGLIRVMAVASLLLFFTIGFAQQKAPPIVIGAPLPAIGGMPRSGIRINDADGFERLGLNLFEDGRMVFGLDAPRGAGDDRNRERINMIADAKGGSAITFKDRRTYVVGRIHLDSANQLWMEFNDFASTPMVTRRLGLKGDEMLR